MQDVDEDDRLRVMHQAAEIFEPETELVYMYLQMFSACCVSFAHGAKDSANAGGCSVVAAIPPQRQLQTCS